ncbi:hypothetical protein L1887_30243 [Cichorium endivia]|nr:hypothetical protein L1887_30243 [Cichorium endivia]
MKPTARAAILAEANNIPHEAVTHGKWQYVPYEKEAKDELAKIIDRKCGLHVQDPLCLRFSDVYELLECPVCTNSISDLC